MDFKVLSAVFGHLDSCLGGKGNPENREVMVLAKITTFRFQYRCSLA